MKAIVVKPGEKGATLKDVELKETVGENEVKLRTLRVGICGTDRGIVTGKLSFARPPEGADYLVLGHEGLARAEEVGQNVDLKEGDLVVPVVRRGCSKCLNCKIGRQDFCETGEFIEAGIRGMQGFMREEFVDDAKYLVKVPRDLGELAVLAEPLSNVMKAYNELVFVQKRSVWNCDDSTFGCRKATIIGSGPIGQFFAMVFKDNGFKVTVVNRRDPNQIEDKISRVVGYSFVNTSKGLDDVPESDVIVDTSGYPSAFIPLLRKMKRNGVLLLFGTVGGEKAEITSDLITFFVEYNISVIGSVNASKLDFEQGMTFLSVWKSRYNGVLQDMITKVVKPEETQDAILEKEKGSIKTVIEWSK
ncbi:Glucose 1-dehydrogenase [Sulfuracidifex tepidarius]|uniref:Glucose 1-dehydrogenase n=1 Tax=Sulfuracidifex tepidarius TaxID=1294262 RepID=A0A510DRT2_9CREN|nr:glucose 1-dehydrogenase [Sulfuracidifex tepidarius]BBG22886.1 Glucose 1-dehydrogenase [Sulfuracidifex tepidarius]